MKIKKAKKVRILYVTLYCDKYSREYQTEFNYDVNIKGFNYHGNINYLDYDGNFGNLTGTFDLQKIKNRIKEISRNRKNIKILDISKLEISDIIKKSNFKEIEKLNYLLNLKNIEILENFSF